MLSTRTTHKLLRMAPCPKCRENGGDKKGNNLGVYEDGCYCFACSYHEKGKDLDMPNVTPMFSPIDEDETINSTPTHDVQGVDLYYNPSEVDNSRGVTAQSFEFFKVQVNKDKHVYPIYSKEDLKTVTGLQTRYLKEKGFSTKGDTTGQAMFGAPQFPKGFSKAIVITEGILDAISAYQMLGGRVACVACQNSTGAKQQLKNNYDYINSFDVVVFALDNDKAGRDALKECAPMFAGKAKVLHFPEKYKDANDVLMGGDSALFSKLFNNSTLWVPDGIVRSDSTLPRLLNYRERLKVNIPYPWAGLNKYLYGIRPGELVTVCAGSGSGKSLVLKEILHWLLKNTKDEIGALFLEESLEKTELNLLGLELNKPLHLPDTQYTEEELTRAWKRLLASGRVFHHDHFGSTQIDNIVSKVRYMATVANCRYVFLDHISIVVSSQENGDERKALDEIVTKLRTLIEETGITIFMVTHLKRVDNAHEEGEQVSLNHLRGSAGIAQLSDAVISLERNQQHPDEKKRNLTLIRVIKNRFSGETGPATALQFEKKTYKLTEVPVEDYLHSTEEAKTKKGGNQFTPYPMDPKEETL